MKLKTIYLLMLTAAFLLGGCSAARKKHRVAYDSCRGLLMAGYQGWFSAEGDGGSRGFYHYRGRDGFRPGSASVDLWPDVTEYPTVYPTEFTMPDGSPGYVFSSRDVTTVDTHFRWMREYGIDGVFMQRFVSEIKSRDGKSHFDMVLDHAMAASRHHHRAISVMYDLSGMVSADTTLILRDARELWVKYGISRRSSDNCYLHHNGCPLIAVWGVGFNDGRRYTLDDAIAVVHGLKTCGFSVLLGVPTYWRELEVDTDADPRLHDLIKECDIVMPWFVGRYDEAGYDGFSQLIRADLEWCRASGVDYMPLVYPGFSWRNLKGEDSFFVARNRGSFFSRQLEGAHQAGAGMIYVAMFDEIDEGTAIFKCSHTVPVEAGGTKFLPLESADDSDLYLRLAGEAARRLKKLPDTSSTY